METLDNFTTAIACLLGRFVVAFIACAYFRALIGIVSNCDYNAFGCTLVFLISPLLLLQGFLPPGDESLRELFPEILIAAIVVTAVWTAIVLVRRRHEQQSR